MRLCASERMKYRFELFEPRRPIGSVLYFNYHVRFVSMVKKYYKGIWKLLRHTSHYKRIAMESSTILTADVLDILFEGRNKEYGAYDLRRTYNKRLVMSITVMLSAILLLF